MMYFVAMKLQGDIETPEYENLQNALKALGAWSNRLGTTWLLECPFSSSRVRDLLKPHLKLGDRLFVAQFNQNWAGTGMGEGFAEWLNRRNFARPQPVN